MKLLRVELAASPAWYVNPLWLSWAGRVTAWRESFDGFPAWRVREPCAVKNARAVIYVEGPDNVTVAQEAGLARQWGGRVGGVDVKLVKIVTDANSCTSDAAYLDSLTIPGKIKDEFDRFGDRAKEILSLAIVLGVVILFAKRSK